MYSFRGITVVAGVILSLSAALLSGCIKDTSDLFVEEVELRAATQVAITNPLGSIKVVGNALNNGDGAVFVKTEKYVDTYSLFGLASPNEYVDRVLATPSVHDGRIAMDVHLAGRGLFDRLFVRIVPHVNRIVETPTHIAATAEVQIGDVELRNLPGDVTASVSVGKVTAYAPLGVFGEQQFDVNVGELTLLLPGDAGFQYDLTVDMGTVESTHPGLETQRRLMGARAAGLTGGRQHPGLVAAKVNIGSISVKTP